MWATLSKYINSTNPLNKQALHNIALMLEAYLDHQNKEEHEEEVFRPDDTTIAERKNDNISGVLKNIKKLLGTVDAIRKIKEKVLVNFKPTYDEQDPGCKQKNEDNLFSSIALSYKIYLDNAKCRGDDDPEFLREKAQLRMDRQPNSKLISSQRVHDFYDNVDEGVIDEAESTDHFHGDLMAVVNYPRSPGRLNQKTITRSLQKVFMHLNGRSPPLTLDDKSKTAVKTNIDVNTASKVLTELQNSSVQNTQLDVNNIALSNEKGYVELSYLVKYPKSVVYRPQYLVKKILSYDDCIKASHLDVNLEEKQLLKVLRFLLLLLEDSTQVLFENREITSTLAIHDIINKASNEANKSTLIEHTSGNIKNENHAHSILKLIEKDKTSNVIGHADSLREEKIIVTVNPVPLQENKIQTGVKQTYSNVNDEIQTNTDHTESLNDFKICSNVNPTDSLQKDKVETDFKQGNFNLQDKMNSHPYPASPSGRNKITINPNVADS
ncbi:unnamed protein product [Arctia plantaginis]|uniref:Uncharacterized protein n=1 Tax=Arctia plantaginis TaxID=874455 RepID=A0A8S1ADN1_ARCPL|nr:unnamed protein product [Arctia plantaginis]